jgi:hypothetical protein
MAGRNQFVVPQFLDVEAKIIGPITARQFIIFLVILLIEFILYRVFLSLALQLVVGLPVLALGAIFAFFKVNGLPFHFLLLNIIQTMRKPSLRVWDKTLSDADIRVFMLPAEVAAPPPPETKSPIERGRLSELTLVVNTGGSYNPED